jgi:hypothetical protein
VRGQVVVTAPTIEQQRPSSTEPSETMIRLKVNEDVYDGHVDPAQHIQLTKH